MLLGGLAGFTIYLGLPIGRLQLLSARARVALAMFSVGILAFIFVDVLEHSFGIVEGALDGFKEGTGSLGHLVALTAVLIAGFAVGSAGLGIIERRLRPSHPNPPPVQGGSGEVAVSPADTAAFAAAADSARRRALQTGLVIAIAIGL